MQSAVACDRAYCKRERKRERERERKRDRRREREGEKREREREGRGVILCECVCPDVAVSFGVCVAVLKCVEVCRSELQRDDIFSSVLTSVADFFEV